MLEQLNWGAGRRRVHELRPRGADVAGTDLRADLVAGLTVAVVALPLALGFGVAAGLGPEAGLVTAIVAGLLAGIFGGSDVQVSGPTGAMAVVLVPVVASVGPSGVAFVALIAGLLLVVAAVLRLGRYAGALPWPVVEGFTVGIALVIALQQVPAALGVERPDGTNTAVVALRALGDWGGSGGESLAVVALVVVVMVGVGRWHRALPASLIAVAVATVVASLLDLPVATIGALPSAIPTPSLPAVEAAQLPSLFGAALAVAALAAVESLLSAKVADGMRDGPAHDPDRELLGQGLANVGVAFVGGMPATGAIARTAVNVRAGARSRVATIVHALVLLALVSAFGVLLQRIPLSALAGVLLVTAVRMVDPSAVRSVLRAGGADTSLLVVTAAATLAFDLVVAVVVGVALAGVLALREVARQASFPRDRELEQEIEVDATLAAALRREHIVAYRLDGALFFGAAQRFLETMARVGAVEVVILRLGGLRLVDGTGAQALRGIVESLQRRGVVVLLVGIPDEHRAALERAGVFATLRHANHDVATIGEALVHARHHHVRGPAAPVAA